MVLPILFLCDKPNACWFYLLHKIFNSIRNPFYCSHYTLFSSLIKRDIETATTRRQKSIYHAQCRSFWLCTSQGICSNSIIVWEEPFKWSTLLLCFIVLLRNTFIPSSLIYCLWIIHHSADKPNSRSTLWRLRMHRFFRYSTTEQTCE